MVQGSKKVKTKLRVFGWTERASQGRVDLSGVVFLSINFILWSDEVSETVGLKPEYLFNVYLQKF